MYKTDVKNVVVFGFKTPFGTCCLLTRLYNSCMCCKFFSALSLNEIQAEHAYAVYVVFRWRPVKWLRFGL